jgi:hypothetical protein
MSLQSRCDELTVELDRCQVRRQWLMFTGLFGLIVAQSRLFGVTRCRHQKGLHLEGELLQARQQIQVAPRLSSQDPT